MLSYYVRFFFFLFYIIYLFIYLKKSDGTSLVVQWLRLQASYARAVGSIPGRETKIPPAFLVSIHLLLHSFSCCVNLLHHLALS